MRRIIKHANRRLYDAGARRVITLLDLSDLIVRGEAVRVIDKASGEDITAVALIQSVLERLRRRPSAGLPAGDADRLVAALKRAITAATAQTPEGLDAEPDVAMSGPAGTAAGAA